MKKKTLRSLFYPLDFFLLVSLSVLKLMTLLDRSELCQRTFLYDWTCTIPWTIAVFASAFCHMLPCPVDMPSQYGSASRLSLINPARRPGNPSQMLNKDREDEARLLPGATYRYDLSLRQGRGFTCEEGICANGSFFGDNRPKGAYEIKPGAIRANRNKPGVCYDCYLMQ